MNSHAQIGRNVCLNWFTALRLFMNEPETAFAVWVQERNYLKKSKRMTVFILDCVET
jgi:hypothetical protein